MLCPLLAHAAITVAAAELPTADLVGSHDNTPPAAADDHIENTRADPLLAHAAITVAAAELPTADLVGSHDNTPPAAADDHIENTRADEVDTAEYHLAWWSEKSNKKARMTSSSKSTETKGGNVDQREQAGTTTSIRRDYSQPSFPTVLMGIMIAPQNAGHIAFLSDQWSFIIIHPDEFAEKVIPTHFNGDDVSSYDQFLHSLTAW